MKKCMAGVAKLGLGIGLVVMLLGLAMLHSPTTEAHPDVAGEAWFSSSEYFTDNVAFVYVYDIDLNQSSSTAETTSVTVNSTADPTGITITLTETGTNTANFSGSFIFVYNTSSSAGRLNVTDRSNVTIQYTDAAPSAVRYNHTMFNYTRNATVFMNSTIFGSSDTVNVTMYDNDTNMNSSVLDSIYIEVTSPSSTNITVALNETGVNTGAFEGNFTLSLGASNNNTKALGISEGDVIMIYLTDSLNTYGNSVTRTNTSMMARNATILFDNLSYYPADTAVLTLHDNDTMANTNPLSQQTVTVNVTSTSDPRGINVTLTETGNDTGIFNGTFAFASNQSSNDTADILNATNGNTITAAYTDIRNGTGDRNIRVTNGTPTYYYRVSGTITMGLSLYGSNSTVNVTLTDLDMNISSIAWDQVTVLVNTTTNATGINLILNETGVNTGVFDGTFTFSISGNTSSTGRLINASHNDEVNVIYNDSTNSSGDTAVITANATFYRSLNAVIGTNGTYLNATLAVFPANRTVFVNISDNDPFANTNNGAFNSTNITISNPDRGCRINITINETGAATGLFTARFNLSETDCHGGLGVMSFTGGGEDWLDINYTDIRNGTADSNVLTNLRVLVDDKPPVFSSVSTFDSDLTYSDGDIINIMVELDQIGANLTANFSSLDSGYVTNAENVTDYGNRTYLINYTISSGNSRGQGQYSINITAYDGAGNGPAHYNYTVMLSELGIEMGIMDFGTLAPRGSGDVVFNVSNTGSATQFNMTEHIEVWRGANLTYNTDANGTRTLYFMVPQNATRIGFSLAANHSGAVLSSTLYDNSGSLQSSALSGTVYPSVSPDSAEVWYMVVNMSNITPTVRVSPNVRVYINTSDWFSSNLTAGADNFSSNSNTTINITINLTILNILPSIYNGTVIYNNSNTSVSAPLTFNISAPNSWHESNASSPVKTLPNSTITLDVNLMRGFNTLRIEINNTGNINLTGVWANLTGGSTTATNLTRGTGTNISISALSGSSGSATSNRHNLSFPDISGGSSAWLMLRFNVSEAGTTEGLYTTYLNIYSANGQPFNESRLTLRVNLTRFLNVTLINITSNQSSPAKPRPGDNITINLSVRYRNGDPVPGLVIGNFSSYDTWTTGSGSVRNRTLGNLSVHDFSLNASGFYLFNYTVPERTTLGKAEYGLHTIIVEAWASNNNIGNGSSSYNVSAPNINISLNSFSSSMSNQTTDAFGISIGSNGTATIYNVSVNISKNGSCVTLNVSSCPIISNITVGQSNTTCSIKVTAGSSACMENITFSAGGVDIHGTAYNVTQESRIVDVTVSGGGTSTTTSSTGGSGTVSCTTDSDCSALYFCNATGYCERVSCTDGFVSDHKCIKYTYGAGIVSYKPSMYVLLGSSNTTSINVNNTGNTTTIDTELTISGEGVSGSVSPASKSLNSMANYTFEVSVSTSNDTGIGNYTATFLAYRSGSKSTNASISFTIVVVPHEERIVEINFSYKNYTSIVEDIARGFEEVKAGGFVSLENLTITERLVNTTKAVLKEIEAAINSGDYAEAERLLKELKAYIAEAGDALDNLRLEQQAGMGQSQGGLMLWIVIGVVLVVIAGFLVYMFLPAGEATAGYKAGGGVPKPGIMNKLGNVLGGIGGRLRKKPGTVAHKMSEYARGYEKQRTLSYERGEGVGKKVKRLLRMFKRK